MRTRDIITAVLMTCIAASSCIKEKLEVTYNAQEDRIDKYINSNRIVKRTVETDDPDVTVTIEDTLRVVYNHGASRLVTAEGTGEELGPNGNVSFYYAGYTFNGSKSYSNMFATNREQTATDAKWEVTDGSYELFEMNMADDELIEGLKNGLMGVKSGEECQILFSGKYGFGKKPFGIIPANSALLYEIWVVAVSND